jgi:glycosyltransferase involved in cell wall biosynthesis
MPEVSVIIPVFNAAGQLARCLDSVCGQTMADLEILCVDDGSTDDSPEILARYAGRDRRIRLLRTDKNRGAAAARNLGLDAAAGTWIGFVDSDDCIDAAFYEKLLGSAAETGAEVAKGSLRRFDPRSGRSWTEELVNQNEKIRRHKAHFYCYFTSALFQSDFLRKHDIRFPEELRYFEDPFFAVKAALHCGRIALVDDARYLYTLRPGSATRTAPNRTQLEAQIQGSHRILDLLDTERADDEHYRIVFGFLLDLLLRWCWRTDASDELTRGAAKGLDDLLSRCRDQKDCLEIYFLDKKVEHRRWIAAALREKIKKDETHPRLSDLRG